DALSRPSLIVLGQLAAHGLIEMELIDLPDIDLRDIRSKFYRDFLEDSWVEAGPRARAARAGGAYLLARGLRPSQLLVLDRKVTVNQRRLTWVVEAREGQ